MKPALSPGTIQIGNGPKVTGYLSFQIEQTATKRGMYWVQAQDGLYDAHAATVEPDGNTQLLALIGHFKQSEKPKAVAACRKYWRALDAAQRPAKIPKTPPGCDPWTPADEKAFQRAWTRYYDPARNKDMSEAREALILSPYEPENPPSLLPQARPMIPVKTRLITFLFHRWPNDLCYCTRQQIADQFNAFPGATVSANYVRKTCDSLGLYSKRSTGPPPQP